MENQHYVCLGDCEGVSDKPGTCQALECITYQQPLTQCNCTDGKHNKMQLPQTDEKVEEENLE